MQNRDTVAGDCLLDCGSIKMTLYFYFFLVIVSVLVIVFLGVRMVRDKDVEGWRYAE